MDFKQADKAIRDINKRNLRAFDRLKTLKFDELNVLQSVTKVYDDAVRIAKLRYQQIAYDAYIAAMVEAGVSEKKARKEAEEELWDLFILDLLEEENETTLYSFDNEIERKKQRLIEALSVAHNKDEEIDKALRLLTLQLAQYADEAVVAATIKGYKDAGIKRVRWVTMEDNRVCAECQKRDGKIYDIDKVPDRAHWKCRCILVPVKTR